MSRDLRLHIAFCLGFSNVGLMLKHKMLKHKKTIPNTSGFSLVELSIVLVILGLLAGGILSAQSLIRASQTRSLVTEYNRYSSAMLIFQDKYFAIPGDMSNAQSFWGVAHATPGTCVTTVGTGTQTCNGDGNGQIYWTWSSAELFRVWQHLANAGLIEGSYTGVQGTAGGAHHVLGVNAPRSRVANSGWGMRWQGFYAGDVNFLAADYGHVMEFGGVGPAEDDFPNNETLTAGEAWNVDMKLDDGKPHTGVLINFKNAYRPNCVNATSDAYLLTNSSIGCSLLFVRVI